MKAFIKSKGVLEIVEQLYVIKSDLSKGLTRIDSTQLSALLVNKVIGGEKQAW